MTREEAKEWLPIIQAWAEGKPIQYQISPGSWGIDINKDLYTSNSPSNSRIRPEPKYRPFKSQEECWKEMQKHKPFGWLKDNGDGHRTLITVVDNEDMMALNRITGWDFLSIMNMYVFADGTPFGVKIEKE